MRFRKKKPTTLTSECIKPSFHSLLNMRHVASRLPLDKLIQVKTLLAGHQHSRWRGRGIDFAEVRVYQPGDDIRHIDWRVTARTGKPHTKLFEEERERPVYCIIDDGPSMQFGTQVAFKSVIAAKAAAAFAWAANQQGDRIGGFLYSGHQCVELPPQSGTKGVLPLLKLLSDDKPPLNQVDSGAMAHCLARLRRVIKPGSLIIILSDFSDFDQQTIQHLTQLRTHNDIMANFIYDPLECEPPPPDQYAISNGEITTNINTYSQDLCKHYRAHFIEHLERVKLSLRALRTPLIKLSTTDNVINALMEQTQQAQREVTHA